jgi:hypothetical protein
VKIPLKIAAATFASISVALLPAFHALAQSNGLGITPKQQFTMKAGEQASNVLYLSNLSKTQTLRVKLTVVDFTAKDETGTPKLLQASDQPQTPWSLKPYLTIPDIVSVPPEGNKQIPFTLKLPASIGAGTYYSAVEYTATAGENQQQVNVAASTATLLFINVPGDVSELLTMKSFGMFDNNKFKSFFQKQPQSFAYRITNSGNVAEQPAGSMIIKNMFGHIVAKVSNANPKGQATRQIGATSHFWYLPLSFIIEALIVIALIVYFLSRLYHRFSRRR